MALIALATHAGQLPAPRAEVDPAAKKSLEAMVKTYRSISRLNQESVYSAGEDKLPPILRSRLFVSRPNRILLEMEQPSRAGDKPIRLLYQCDGKHIYSYQESFGRYVKEKAPKNFQDMKHLAMSIELAAITGLDPVSSLLAQARSVKLSQSALSDGTATDIVTFDLSTPLKASTLKLTIGQKDHLLRRFELSVIPTVLPAPEKSEPEDPNAPPPPLQIREEPTFLAYDNHVSREVPKDAFLWIAPAGAFESREYPSFLNPTAGAKSVAGNGQALPPGVKPMKIIKFEDLMKEAWKKKK